MNYQRMILGGRLTRDPQIKHLPNTVVCEFGVAVNEKRGDNERTHFYDCKAFGKTAELIGQYFAKGKPIFVDGRPNYDSWDAKDGSGKRSKVEMIVDNFQFIGAREAGGDRESSEARETVPPSDDLPY